MSGNNLYLRWNYSLKSSNCVLLRRIAAFLLLLQVKNILLRDGQRCRRFEDAEDHLPFQQQNLTDYIQRTNCTFYMQDTSFRDKKKLSYPDHFYDLMETSITHHLPKIDFLYLRMVHCKYTNDFFFFLNKLVV
jgi:hypothetical protein